MRVRRQYSRGTTERAHETRPRRAPDPLSLTCAQGLPMRVLVVGYGIQGKKRLRIAGADAIGMVDPVATEAPWRDISEVPVDRYDAALVCTPDNVKLALL